MVNYEWLYYVTSSDLLSCDDHTVNTAIMNALSTGTLGVMHIFS